ncbi:hypothetical protein [Caldimonas tepidiphila]|uniref:hypothetical protein n=1 Tax=Caldimonas tepidiphila TaxID=2315841 RepID=UPI000E5C1653|nr:hypothetical protein [Caldimonas tepidiphila]
MDRLIAPPKIDLTMDGLAERLGMFRIDARDLEQAWQITHRPGASLLSWGQRFLVLSSLFEGRPTSWVLALEARLCALEAWAEARGDLPPDAHAFETAAQAALQPRGAELQFPPDTPW